MAGVFLFFRKEPKMKNTLHMLQSQTDTICNSFIVTTEDGKVIVIDGGYETERPYFVSYLQKLTGKQTPHIDVWILTHPHEDHVNTFFDICEHHPDEVTFDRVYLNFPSKGLFEGVDDSAKATMDDFYRVLPLFAKKLRLLCGGDVFTIGKAKFYVLSSQDFTFRNCNNQSLVFRMELGKSSVLFTADCEAPAGEKILRLWKDSGLLDCDICTMAHHGQGGVDKSFYEAVMPKICLWPTPEWLWTNCGGDGPFKTLETRKWVQELGIETHYVMKDGTCVLEL